MGFETAEKYLFLKESLSLKIPYGIWNLSYCEASSIFSSCLKIPYGIWNLILEKKIVSLTVWRFPMGFET